MSASPSARPRARRLIRSSELIRPALLLAGAWALPLATYALHVAWLVPPVVLLAAASLLRGGPGLLDRVVMAAVLLYGSVCVGGLLLSIWPWRLHPVAVGGVALTTLVLFGLSTGRRPALPRPGWADGLSLAAAAGVGLAFAVPMVGAGDEVRLSTLMLGWDGVRHSVLIDTIRHIGGYLFVRPDQSAEHIYGGLVHYPQAGHLLYGLLDGFVRSSGTDAGSGMSALNHYLGFAALNYALFAVAVIWAVQRLAEPLLTAGRRLVLVAVASVYVLGNGTFRLAMLHFTSQVLALGLVAVLAAVLARPPARTVQALWLVAALLVGVGFTYYLYLPPAALAVLIWLYARRRRVARYRVMLAVTLAAGALAVVPAVIGLVVARQDAALLAEGAAPEWDGMVATAGIAAAGLLRARRTPRWRVHRWVIGCAVLALAGIALLQRLHGGGAGPYYYTDKILDLTMLMLLLSVGSLLAFLPSPRNEPARWRGIAPAVAVVVAVAAGAGLVVGDSPFQPGGAVIARGWVAGAWRDYYRPTARIALAEAAREVPAGTVTMVIRENPADSWTTQELVSAMLRESGLVGPALHARGVYNRSYEDPDWYDRMLTSLAPHPVLIVVDSAPAMRTAQALRDRHPDLPVTIAYTDR